MEASVGLAALQEKTGQGVLAENKDVCVTCQHHAPKGHGESWWACMLRAKSMNIWVPGLYLLTSIPNLKMHVGWSTLVIPNLGGLFVYKNHPNKSI